METKFNFKSAICTSREQSERLLALGLKPETADMAYRTTGKVVDMGEVRWMYQHNPSVVYKGMMCKEDIPAWSLHRLIEIVPSTINKMLWFTITPYTALYDSVDYIKSFDSKDNLYDNIIDCIEWLIKEKYFKNEYLEEKL